MQKKFKWQLQGMMQDMSEASQSAKYAVEARNVRFNVDTEASQMMSVTSEEAPLKAPFPNGKVMGTLVLPNNRVMFFTTTGIYVNMEQIDTVSFDEHTPVEALCYTESDSLWKIYINDAINEPRYMIYKDGYFHLSKPFSQSVGVKSAARIVVEKNSASAPLFPTGSIQYAYRVYDENGSATGLLGLSQLQYITGDPSVNQQVSFSVHLPYYERIGNHRLQLYSIHRATQYAQPEVKLVYDGAWNANTNFVDTNVGAIVDSTEPLFFGCKKITAETMEISGNKLFVGGYKISTKDPSVIHGQVQQITIAHPEYKSYKDVNPYFKKGENYRLGVQLLDKSGNWSTVKYIDDADQTQDISFTKQQNVSQWNVPAYTCTVTCNDRNFVSMRPVVVFPDDNDRIVIAQGLVTPAVRQYNNNGGAAKVNDEFDYASDWFFRPNDANDYQRSKEVLLKELNPQNNNAVKDLQWFENNVSVCSLYSPEFEYTNIQLDGKYVLHKSRLSAPSVSYIEKMITTSTPLKPSYRPETPTNVYYGVGFDWENKKSYGGSDLRRFVNPKGEYMWHDGVNHQAYTASYDVAPWQCDGPLCINDPSDDPKYSMLRYNQTAIYMSDDTFDKSMAFDNANVNCTLRTVGSTGLYKIGQYTYSAGINTSIRMPQAQYDYRHGDATTPQYDTEKRDDAILNMNYNGVAHAVVYTGSNELRPSATGLFVTDVIREFDEDAKVKRFGGRTQEALMSNHWDVAGEAVSIGSDGAANLTWEWGDTFIGKYDILKSYSPTDAVNQVVSVYSVILETRINMNNRYDKNINKKYFIGATAENFQKVNYSANTTTTYSNAVYAKPEDQSYSSSISWSLTKHGGELIDPFLQLSLDASLQLDGTYGKCTSVYAFNNQLLAFQDKAVNLIHYNERTVLTAQAGVPVTIANNAAVDGYTTISNNVGCMNKFSITDCNAGLFFVDQYNKAMMRFDGKSFIDLGVQYGMKSWENFYIQQSNMRDWYVTAYDRDVNDVLFTMRTDSGEDRVIAFNTQMNCFTSMYDYLKCQNSYYYNGKMHFVYDNEDYELRGDVMHSMPCTISVIANNPDITDMIFDQLEVVSDRWTPLDGWDHDSFHTFDTIGAITQYQSSFGIIKSPLMKKKFNVFRINIPRCQADYGRIADRIRGPWAKFTLSTVDTEDKIKLSMLQATYSV